MQRSETVKSSPNELRLPFPVHSAIFDRSPAAASGAINIIRRHVNELVRLGRLHRRLYIDAMTFFFSIHFVSGFYFHLSLSPRRQHPFLPVFVEARSQLYSPPASRAYVSPKVDPTSNYTHDVRSSVDSGGGTARKKVSPGKKKRRFASRTPRKTNARL